jgi:enamine deaminase RidA (YjgF/YER057c/UK114 family)
MRFLVQVFIPLIVLVKTYYMSERKNFSSGAKWEDIVGYSRAVLIGNQLEISGTVAADENGVVAEGDCYLQTKFILTKINKILLQAGFTMNDVIRTRMFVTDISKWEEIGKAHGEFFKEIKPSTSMVEVSALIDPKYLVEIEATAVR